ncbi:MAG: M6 family metalloprotease domain-containing protein, partial [Anaerolineae bacterium]|nr:M6 family metalloprotease domain-containing protein [Anaerolineae bacterium]
SVTMVSLRRLAELKQEKGIDKPQPIAAPVIGQRPALVLLVDFGDLAHDSVSTAGMYNNLLFCYRWCTEPGSMFQYFGEASHGKLDIYPRGMCDWQQTGQPHDYYADADGIPGTDDDYGFGSFPQNAQGLVVDAVLLADPFINFRTYALGGQVHGLFVVHAGRGAETDPSHADWIWSHQWELGPHAVTADWVTVDEYVMCPEYTYDPGDSSIGVFCHEYAHLLGLPDLYDTDYSSAGVGDWSLMASGSWNLGGTSPAYPDAWCRTQLGWATPQVPDDPFEDDVFVGDVASYNSVYQLWTRNETGPEYFLVEKRRWISND